MSDRLKAIFRDGHFVPLQPYNLPEGAEVDITVDLPALVRPRVADPERRRRILAALADRMRQNPWPWPDRRLTRGELHDRR